MQKKTLAELAEEYFQSAELVAEMIVKNREKLKSLENPHCGREAVRLKSLISMLYDQRRELCVTGCYLRDYYKT